MAIAQNAGLGYCSALLESLGAIATPNNPAFRATPVGFMQYLKTPGNDTLEVQRYDQGDGHQVDVRVKYLQRGVESDVRTTHDCTAPAHKAYKETSVVIDTYVETSISLSFDEVKKYCSDASNYMNMGQKNVSKLMKAHTERILTAMNPLRTKLNKALITLMGSQFSALPTSSSNPSNTKILPGKDISVIRTTDTYGTGYGAPLAQGIEEINFDFINSELTGTPYIVGFGNFQKFNSILQHGCCNVGGIDFGSINSKANYNYYQDLTFSQQVNGTTEANSIGVFAPGVVQLITFNKHRGDFAGQIGASEYGTFPDPFVQGLDWDIQLDFDTCNKVFNLIISVTAGLFVLPNDTFATGDRLYTYSSVNGAFLYRAQAV